MGNCNFIISMSKRGMGWRMLGASTKFVCLSKLFTQQRQSLSQWKQTTVHCRLIGSALFRASSLCWEIVLSQKHELPPAYFPCRCIHLYTHTHTHKRKNNLVRWNKILLCLVVVEQWEVLKIFSIICCKYWVYVVYFVCPVGHQWWQAGCLLWTGSGSGNWEDMTPVWRSGEENSMRFPSR